MNFLSKTKFSFKGRTVILRVDLNIENENVSPFHPRITGVLPTIKFLRKNGARVVILSHRGRPRTEAEKKTLSLKPFAGIFSNLLGVKVDFVDYKKLSAPSIETLAGIIKHSPAGAVFLLENTRFFKGEEENSEKVAKRFAAFGDFFVNDAFSVSHRDNASVSAISKILPGFAGLLFEKEMENLSAAMKNPARPMIVILGGAKISDKIGLIKNLKSKTDFFLIGGGIANTIFNYQGLPMGDSLFEPEIDLGFLSGLIDKKVILPVDVNIKKRSILDIGPETIKKYDEMIAKARTIVWNGPMGYFEKEEFAKGTEKIKKSVLKNKRAKIIVGGGETASIFCGKYPKNVFVSTGGGAMLEFLSGKKLPGIDALKRKQV